MKLVLALLFASLSFSATATVAPSATPSVMTVLEKDNSITVSVSNNADQNLECYYSVSWLINTLSYKNEYGVFDLPASGEVTANFKNDKFARISRIHSQVFCK